MSGYIEITEAQSDAGSVIDEDLTRGTAGADPDGGYRGNLRNLDARATVLEGSSGGGAAGIEVCEKFTELKKKFGDGVVDSSQKALEASFFTEQTIIEYRLMRDIAASATTAYIMANPKFLDGVANEDFDQTSFAWTTHTGTDADTITADSTNNEIGTDAPAWSKGGGTSTLSAIARDVGVANVIGVGGHRVWFQNWRTPDLTNVTDCFIRLSTDTVEPATNYSEWRVTTQQDGSGFIASGSGVNILKFDITATPDATAGTPFDLESNQVRSMAFGVIYSSSGQTTGQMTIDSGHFSPSSGQGLAEVVPEYQQLWTPGDAGVIINSSTKELFIPDQATTEVGGETTIVALSNSYVGGSASTIRRSSLKTSEGRAEFNDDAATTSGTSETDQDFIEKIILPASITAKNVDASVDIETNLHGFINAKPLSTTFTIKTDVDFSAQFVNGDTLSFYTVTFANGKLFFEPGTLVTLTANSSFSVDTITFTVSSGGNALLSTGMFVIKRDEVQTAVYVGALNTNDSIGSFTTPSSRPVSDVGFAYPGGVDKVFGHWKLGGLSTTEAARNRVPGLDLSLTGTLSIDKAFKSGQFGAGPFSDANYYSLTGAQSEPIDPDSAASSGGLISGAFWIFVPVGGISAQKNFLVKHNNAAAGFNISINASEQLLLGFVGVGTQLTSAALNLDAWNFCSFVINDLTETRLRVNSTEQVSTTGANIGGASTIFHVGRNQVVGTSYSDGELADLIMWSNYTLTMADHLQMFSAGNHRPVGCTPGGFKHRISLTSQTGQKIVTRHNIVRETNAQLTQIRKAVTLSLG